MGVFSFSLGLDAKKFSARDIRNIILELGQLLSKYQDLIVKEELKYLSKEQLIEKLSKMNEILEGFKYQSRRKEE